MQSHSGGSSVLRALTTSALALPGFADRAAGESAPLEVRTDYRYSLYSEDPVSRNKVLAGGETERYEVDIHQFRFATPIGDRFDLGLELAHETMSGATPWYLAPDPDGGDDPVQVMTEASIEDTRTDALVTGSWYQENGKTSLGTGFSTENDYLSINGSLGRERHYNEKNTTLSFGVGGSFDQIEPTQDGGSLRVDSEDKQSYSGFLGVSQVLGRGTAIQSSLKYQHMTGFLSDPYKQAFVVDGPVPDARPDTRNQLSWLTRYRHHVRSFDATLHFDYKFYLDDWDIHSHTLELAWYQTFFDRFRLVPGFRYYSQSQADFYAPIYASARSDGLASSDYRLSPYGAVSARLKLETRFQTWNLLWDANVAWERYVSSADYAIESVDVENPGLVSFNLFSVGLTARF